MEICGREECSRRGSNKRMECKGRPKWRDAPLTMKAPYKRGAQDDDDRGTGAQAADSAVAPGHDRRGAGRCRAAAGGVSNTVERERTNRVRHLIALDAPGSR